MMKSIKTKSWGVLLVMLFSNGQQYSKLDCAFAKDFNIEHLLGSVLLEENEHAEVQSQDKNLSLFTLETNGSSIDLIAKDNSKTTVQNKVEEEVSPPKNSLINKEENQREKLYYEEKTAYDFLRADASIEQTADALSRSKAVIARADEAIARTNEAIAITDEEKSQIEKLCCEEKTAYDFLRVDALIEETVSRSNAVRARADEAIARTNDEEYQREKLYYEEKTAYALLRADASIEQTADALSRSKAIIARADEAIARANDEEYQREKLYYEEKFLDSLSNLNKAICLMNQEDQEKFTVTKVVKSFDVFLHPQYTKYTIKKFASSFNVLDIEARRFKSVKSVVEAIDGFSAVSMYRPKTIYDYIESLDSDEQISMHNEITDFLEWLSTLLKEINPDDSGLSSDSKFLYLVQKVKKNFFMSLYIFPGIDDEERVIKEFFGTFDEKFWKYTTMSFDDFVSFSNGVKSINKFKDYIFHRYMQNGLTNNLQGNFIEIFYYKAYLSKKHTRFDLTYIKKSEQKLINKIIEGAKRDIEKNLMENVYDELNEVYYGSDKEFYALSVFSCGRINNFRDFKAKLDLEIGFIPSTMFITLGSFSVLLKRAKYIEKNINDEIKYKQKIEDLRKRIEEQKIRIQKNAIKSFCEHLGKQLCSELEISFDRFSSLFSFKYFYLVCFKNSESYCQLFEYVIEYHKKITALSILRNYEEINKINDNINKAKEKIILINQEIERNVFQEIWEESEFSKELALESMNPNSIEDLMSCIKIYYANLIYDESFFAVFFTMYSHLLRFTKHLKKMNDKVVCVEQVKNIKELKNKIMYLKFAIKKRKVEADVLSVLCDQLKVPYARNYNIFESYLINKTSNEVLEFFKKKYRNLFEKKTELALITDKKSGKVLNLKDENKAIELINEIKEIEQR